MIGLIPKQEHELTPRPSITWCASRLEEIVQRLEEGDGHFVLAVDANSNWISYITLDQDAEVVDHRGLGVGDTAYEAIDRMLAA